MNRKKPETDEQRDTSNLMNETDKWLQEDLQILLDDIALGRISSAYGILVGLTWIGMHWQSGWWFDLQAIDCTAPDALSQWGILLVWSRHSTAAVKQFQADKWYRGPRWACTISISLQSWIHASHNIKFIWDRPEQASGHARILEC